MNSNKLEVEELLKIQPGLVFHDGIIEGEILINLHHNGYYISDTYNIKIDINKESPFNSKVYETKGAIRNDYEHKYSDGMLCLSTPIDLKVSESKNCSLVAFYNDFIEPYFFSYDYFERYGYYPFEDRRHGLEGVLDSYCDIVGIKDYSLVWELIRDIALRKYKYRGHAKCPCGSNKKARNCHPNILDLCKDYNVIEQVIEDYKYILRVVNGYKKQTK